MGALERLGLANLATRPQKNKDYSHSQEQTKDTFGFKWAQRDTYESDAMAKAHKAWLIERYCDGNPAKVETWLAGGPKIILDVGCGSGYSASLLFGDYLKEHDYLGVDISDSVKILLERFAERGYPAQCLQESLMELPLADGSVDIILAEGVLHHTDDTRLAVEYLSRKLKPSGRFLFYVYAKKAVIREFTDDYIREQIRGFSNEEAWEALKPLTALGESLGKAGVTIQVPQDIPFLGIPKGEMDLQAFFYWNICKAFFRPEFSMDEMNHINFDWFRPLNCHRHTKEEVLSFCEGADLEIEHFNAQPSGYTVVAKRL